jgi:dipeptidyl aminopeptidase/acylaminoacyl peptidase
MPRSSKKFVYLPELSYVNIDWSKQSQNMVEIYSTEFASEGETIRGNFVVPDGDGPFPGICKYHGLPDGPDQVASIPTRLAEAGFGVLTFDFRGFRRSDGLFTLAGEIKDAHAAITHLLESDMTVDSWAGVYGSSYGGAVAVCAAADDRRVNALCLRAPVYDTLWFARSPMIRPEVDYLVANDPTQIRGLDNPAIQAEILHRMVEDARVHNPMNEISKILWCPLLIVHGTDDVGIDLAGVKRLYELANEPKDLVVVEGADHELSDPRAYEITVNTVVEWFKRMWTDH